MISNQIKKTAIVRKVPPSFQKCITTFNAQSEIDLTLARLQHQRYCDTLSGLGIEIVKLDPDDDLPDCCFVEDTAIVAGNTAIITFPGASSRVAETIATEKILAQFMEIFHITGPGRIDGGDVMKIGRQIFIGLSARTNMEAIDQVRSILEPGGYEVIPVKLKNALHFKSVCTSPGEGTVVMKEGHFDPGLFSDFNRVIVPNGEDYAANTLNVNGKVLMPAGFEKTRLLIEKQGFDVIPLEMSEFRKADGALTCLSVIFEN
jgi:dimethylargininase